MDKINDTAKEKGGEYEEKNVPREAVEFRIGFLIGNRKEEQGKSSPAHKDKQLPDVLRNNTRQVRK